MAEEDEHCRISYVAPSDTKVGSTTKCGTDATSTDATMSKCGTGSIPKCAVSPAITKGKAGIRPEGTGTTSSPLSGVTSTSTKKQEKENNTPRKDSGISYMAPSDTKVGKCGSDATMSKCGTGSISKCAVSPATITAKGKAGISPEGTGTTSNPLSGITNISRTSTKKQEWIQGIQGKENNIPRKEQQFKQQRKDRSCQGDQEHSGIQPREVPTIVGRQRTGRTHSTSQTEHGSAARIEEHYDRGKEKASGILSSEVEVVYPRDVPSRIITGRRRPTDRPQGSQWDQSPGLPQPNVPQPHVPQPGEQQGTPLLPCARIDVQGQAIEVENLEWFFGYLAAQLEIEASLLIDGNLRFEFTGIHRVNMMHPDIHFFRSTEEADVDYTGVVQDFFGDDGNIQMGNLYQIVEVSTSVLFGTENLDELQFIVDVINAATRREGLGIQCLMEDRAVAGPHRYSVYLRRWKQ